MFGNNTAWELKASKSAKVQGKGLYQGEWVEIIDVLVFNNKVELMINYEGAKWVSQAEVALIEWYV